MTMLRLFQLCTVMVLKSVLVCITAACECDDQQPGYQCCSRVRRSSIADDSGKDLALRGCEHSMVVAHVCNSAACRSMMCFNGTLCFKLRVQYTSVAVAMTCAHVVMPIQFPPAGVVSR